MNQKTPKAKTKNNEMNQTHITIKQSPHEVKTHQKQNKNLNSSKSIRTQHRQEMDKNISKKRKTKRIKQIPKQCQHISERNVKHISNLSNGYRKISKL